MCFAKTNKYTFRESRLWIRYGLSLRKRTKKMLTKIGTNSFIRNTVKKKDAEISSIFITFLIPTSIHSYKQHKISNIMMQTFLYIIIPLRRTKSHEII